MRSVASFAAVNTKAKALKGKLLTKDQYEELINAKDYVQAISYLKENTNYKEALKNYNIQDLHRGQLEKILKIYYTKSFYKFSHYLRGDYKNLIKVLFMKLEIEDLKVILRGKYLGREKEDLQSLMAYKNPLSEINYDGLISARNIEEATEILKNTKYYNHIFPLINSIKEEGMFRVEMSLDFSYFSELRKIEEKIHKESREILKSIIGVYSDLLNIQWIFRGKKYYNIAPEILLNYTIYDGYRLHLKDLKNLCYSKNMDELFTLIKYTPYIEVFGEGKKDDHLIESDILRYMKNLYLKYAKENPMDISIVVSYLELALLEIKYIVSIIEGRRYSLDSQEIHRYISDC
ncbi:V/A-type H+-transporting ATPase subunit C [Clostridium pascui]|uniref:V-type ATPase subunit n=1 Tax=Clostridium pascui TaxID=46609 RepID=UPI001956BCAD|nr:V-type ATPase subunit [Clostridium pascui]MBM7870007.1 V/A-type H+-transporting ATPase subunit C [Clostridium pascui]